MLKIKPKTLRKDGKDQFVVLTTEEYEQIQQLLQDAEDVLALRAAKAKEEHLPSIPIAEVKRRLATRRKRSA